MQAQNAMGMFGPSIESLRATIEAENRPRFNDDFLQATSGAARQGLYSIAEGMGGGDPRIQRAQKIKQVVEELRSSGIDVSDPSEFYPALSEKLYEAGLHQEAEAVAQRFRAEASESSLKRAQTVKALAEANKANTEKKPKIVQLRNEYVAAKQAGDDDTAALLLEAIAKENQARTDKVTEGVEGAPDQVRDVLIGPDGKPTYAGQPRRQNPLVQNDFGPREGTKAIAETNVVKKKAFDLNRAALHAIRSVMGDIGKIVKGGNLDTGFGSEWVKTAKSVLYGMKLLSEDQMNTLSNNELLSKYAMELVLPQMQKLGGSDSNEELRKLMQSVANGNFSMKTLDRIVRLYNRELARADLKAEEIRKKWNPKTIGEEDIDMEDTSAIDPILKQRGLDVDLEDEGTPLMGGTKKTEAPAPAAPRVVVKGEVRMKNGIINLDVLQKNLRANKVSPADEKRIMDEARQRNAALAGTGGK